MTTLEPTLIYAYDPLCGWCFGFHPVVARLAKRFGDRVRIRVVPGGLAIDENATSISEGYTFIPDGSKQVEQTTGAQFGENFILLAEEGSYFYNSEPACIAQTVVNKLADGKTALEFAGRMQNALFKEGKSLNEWTTFRHLMQDINLDVSVCRSLYEDEKTVRETRRSFKWCKENGASAFPTLLLQLGRETGILTRGYRPFDTLEAHLHHLLNNLEKLL